MEMLDTKYAVSSHTLDEMEQLVFDLEDSYFLIHPTARNYLESRAKGAIMSGLNMGIIKELPVELPPIEKQNDFSKLKQKVILQKELMVKELLRINSLFESLQNQAFSGNLSRENL